MIFVYVIAILIIFFWLIESFSKGRLNIKRTPLDIPILIFLASQIISTIFSIDPYISLWGYYGRFNGGLISTITYVVLYYAFVSHFSQKDLKIKPFWILCFSILFSAFLVSIYGTLQHYGIDKHVWVQDVQNRVFSTLGQPNWLAAYLTILIPIILALSLIIKLAQKESLRFKEKYLSAFLLTTTLFLYLVLLYTKSRSGLIAFWVDNVLFWLVFFLWFKVPWEQFRRYFFIFNFILLILTLYQSPFPQINKLFSKLPVTNYQLQKAKTPSSSSLKAQPQADSRQLMTDNGITESGDIRLLVWQGAINAFKAKPITGWGVETFAWVFYKYKPLSHNLTSEWDFLYNKAHNEYLNYAATSGILGLGSYMSIIIVFTFFVIRMIKADAKQMQTDIRSNPLKTCLPARQARLDSARQVRFHQAILKAGLYTGWTSILITNFFGFSVVAVSLFFWLIPAFIFSFDENKKDFFIRLPKQKIVRNILCLFFILLSLYSLFSTSLFWLADVFYAKSTSFEIQSEHEKGYDAAKLAVEFVPTEPNFHDQLGMESAYLSLIEAENNDATKSASLIKEAISESDKALEISSANLNFWKTRTRLFYLLSQIDPTFLKNSIHSLLTATILAPNDAKIHYNLGLLYYGDDQKEEAKKTMEKALTIKPNYKDVAQALAVFAANEKNSKEEQKWYHYILEKIDPNDAEIKKKIVNE